jgi:hypothetical protein
MEFKTRSLNSSLPVLPLPGKGVPYLEAQTLTANDYSSATTLKNDLKEKEAKCTSY